MAASNTACSVCFLSYNEQVRRPLVLPCSHSYCQECLQSLDDSANKLCPCCRESWDHVAVTDLAFCRQLLPVQATTEDLSVCERHGVGLLLWCENCRVTLCLKCRQADHRDCQCTLINEKTADLEKKCIETLTKIKPAVLSNVETEIKVTHAFSVINFLDKELNTTKKEITDYKKKYNSWQIDMKKELSLMEGSNTTATSHKSSVPSLEQTLAKMQAPRKPGTILVHIANAYAAARCSAGDTSISNFIENLNELCKSEAVEGDVGASKTAELKEGQAWTLADYDSASAAIVTLTNTSIRPTAVTIKGLVNWPDAIVEELLKLLSRIPCPVRLFMTDNFTEGSDDTSRTKQLIYLFTKALGVTRGTGMEVSIVNPSTATPQQKLLYRCYLVEVWGHLDLQAVQMLPSTVWRIGLVLASAADTTAVGHAFVAFSGLRAIDLCVMQTFQAEHWSLNLSPAPGTAVSVALHFSDVTPSQFRWMTDLLDKIGLGFLNSISHVVHLYLPGTTLSPDAVLGAVRDCRCISSVHLPPGLTPNHRKVELETQFRMHKCSIVWNTEYGLPLKNA